jgi:NAD(P)-dependent dehydrogenase (short-subunit alcohol dehydrogenase family)
MRILITGGTGTIGEYLVSELSREHEVHFTYFSNKNKAIELERRTGAVAHRLDVTDEPYSPDMIDLRDSITGDGLVQAVINNAGVNIPNNFGNISHEQWHRVIDVNLTGVYNVTKLMLNHISYGGRVINIGSVSADLGGKVSSHYAASKAGLVGLTRNLALYLADRNITCNTVSPGYVESDMANSAMNETVRKTIESIPLGRLCRVADVYGVIRFILSDDASYITGQDIKVNGGLSW